MLKNSLSLLIILFSITAISPLAHAAEVINLKTGQSGDKGFATYDLAGKIGEREAEVSVKLTINDEGYSSEKLTLTGDFGKKVKTGVGRRIVWDILADIPAGFDGEVVWDVTAVSAPAVKEAPEALPAPAKPAPSLPKPEIKPLAIKGTDSRFQIAEMVVRDMTTGLIWLREVSKDGDGVNLGKARSAAKKLKEQKYAGCIEWRIPWEEEMKSLVLYAVESGYSGKKTRGYPADFYNSIGFKGVANDYFWTESSDLLIGMHHSGKIAVDLEDGIPKRKSPEKDYLHYWPVCKPD